MTEDRKRYTKRELENIWGSGFRDEPDEIQAISDFADCDTTIAAEMIKGFKATAKARRAAEAEANRKKPRKEKAPPVETEEITEVSEPFPASDLIAAAVNSSHGFSRVLASGLARDRKRSVIVERVTRNGEYIFREKYTVYSYYKGKDEAIQQAKKRRLKLTVYSSDK